MTTQLTPPPDDVTEALAVLDGLPAALKANAGAWFQEPYRSALKVVQLKHPGEWSRYRRLISKAGVSVRILDKGLRSERDTESDNGGALTKPVPAADMLPGVPTPDLLIPPPYYLTPSAVAKWVSGSRDGDSEHEQIVTHAPIVISGRLKDADEHLESLRVAWLRGAGWQHATVDRGKLLSSSKITELASIGFPVAEPIAKDVVTYLNTLEATNYDQIPCGRVSSHLGWQGKNGELGFLWGRTLLSPDGMGRITLDLDDLPPDKWASDAVAFRGAALGDDQLARGFYEGGTYEAWVATVGRLVPYPRALLALYTSFVPPLLQILRLPNFSADWANRTSTGKTSVLRTAASVWGNPDEKSPDTMIHPWNMTRVWLERAAGVLSGLPIFMDDTRQARKPEQIAESIYLIGNGQGRGRGNIKGLAPSRNFHTVLLSTGEAPATSSSEKGGSVMRCMEIRGLPFGEESEEMGRLADGLYLSLLVNFGHAGPRFVQYLLQHRDRWPTYAAAHKVAMGQLISLSTDSAAGRLASYAAAIEVAAKMAHDALNLPWGYTDTVRTLWPAIVAEASDAAGEYRALLDVVSVAYSRQEAFHERIRPTSGDPKIPAGGWLGRWDFGDDWTFIAFYPPLLKKILTDLHYEPEGIVSGWQERGWLDTEPGRRTKSTRCGNDRTHMIVIRKAAILEAERGHRGRIGDGSGDAQEEDI